MIEDERTGCGGPVPPYLTASPRCHHQLTTPTPVVGAAPRPLNPGAGVYSGVPLGFFLYLFFSRKLHKVLYGYPSTENVR